MKTNYHLRARKRTQSLLKLSLVLVVCALLAFTMKGTVAKSISYLGSAILNASGALVPPGLRSAYSLGKENQSLREKIITLSSENADRNVLAAENESLKQMLGRKVEEDLVYAVVIQKPPYSPFDTFILDAGTKDGVSVGNTVVVGNLSIGKIVEAGSSYSKAEMYSSPGNTFEGRLGPKNIKLQAVGEGGGAFSALLPIGTAISEGDDLILPSISSKVFGTVVRVEDMPEEGFKKAVFGLPINISEVGFVGILIDR